MIDTLLNVVYVLVAIGMIVLILLQRGAGAQAGSGFGAGASGTVFGARGSANFLSSSTKYLAAVFFGLSLFMAYQASKNSGAQQGEGDLGIMAELPAAGDKPAGATLAPAPGQLVPAPTVPAAPIGAPATPAIAPAASQPAPASAPPQTNPTPADSGDSKGG